MGLVLSFLCNETFLFAIRFNDLIVSLIIEFVTIERSIYRS